MITNGNEIQLNRIEIWNEKRKTETRFERIRTKTKKIPICAKLWQREKTHCRNSNIKNDHCVVQRTGYIES